jgi:hypothetical protein
MYGMAVGKSKDEADWRRVSGHNQRGDRQISANRSANPPKIIR